MSLILAVETSSPTYGVAVCTPRELVAVVAQRRDEPSFDGIGSLAGSALAAAGLSFDDVQRLAVNAGPGNLGSIRAGVAYVNGLGFSLDKPIFAANALRLLALEASQPEGTPVLALRNAGGGDVYAGLIIDDVVTRLAHGPLADLVTSMAGDLPNVALAGTFRAEVAALLPRGVGYDTGIEFSDVHTLCRLLRLVGDEPTGFVALASPLTDASPVFR